jgi:hypothetical protein
MAIRPDVAPTITPQAKAVRTEERVFPVRVEPEVRADSTTPSADPVRRSLDARARRMRVR